MALFHRRSVAIVLLLLSLPTGSAYSQTQSFREALAAIQARDFVRSESISISAELSGPDALSARTYSGQEAGENSGVAVAAAGDVNGDGFADVIVGSPTHDAAGVDAGRAYIFFGSATQPVNRLVNTADVILTGEAAGDFFGLAVATAGDVNGDGYADVIVGAYFNDGGGTDFGRAYIYYGGASMNSTADVVLTGLAASDFFGRSVATAGDVNGDGFSDVVVGAYGNDTAGSAGGQAYVFYGGSSMDTVADVTMTGEAGGDNFGVSVSSAGDVNADGYADVVISGHLNDTGGNDRGRAYIFLGDVSMDGVADVVLSGEAADDQFGSSVSGAGDVNNDGYSDVVVGGYLNDAGGTNTGRAYVFYGGASMDNTADVTMTGQTAGDNFGESVSGAGDIDGDGYTDVIVGAYLNDAAGASAGRAYVFRGGSTMDALADIVLTGEAADDRFGTHVSAGGDVNGDGYDDFLVGGNRNDGGGTDAGRSYLYINKMTGVDLPDYTLDGVSPVDGFGYSVASAGDVNGDGYADIIVGAYLNDIGGADAGRAYVFFGGVNFDSIADVVLTGFGAGDWFGQRVASAGDVNGDGFSDVIVGAQRNDAGGSNAGRAYVYFGGASMDTGADVILTGEAPGDIFGESVSTAGDVNGDGYGDVIVGASGNDAAATGAGRAYIFFGGAAMNNVADVTLTGGFANDAFGISVASAGDVNGDGYMDVIVGSPGTDGGGTDAGAAFIFFGGAIDATADVIIYGLVPGGVLGFSVASVGDINLDGFDDVIAGAFFADKAYVYLGGESMDVNPALELIGEFQSSFGGLVGAAGDINRDGFPDFMVGSVNAGASSEGRLNVYFGGIQPDAISDVFVSSQTPNTGLGWSAARAGDINGDGVDDLLVGTDANRAFIHLSTPPAVTPRITSVSDVPGDQGGQVELSWTRSGFDYPGLDHIDHYSIQRSPPPGAHGFSWQDIGTQAPIHDSFYGSTAATPADQVAAPNNTYYFRVTAHGVDGELWKSAYASGASIDNLAPAAPLNAMAVPQGVNVMITWDENTTDSDVREYNVYRSAVQGFTPSPATLFGETTDTELLDDMIASGGTYYYRVTTEDVHLNESVPSAELSYDSPLPITLGAFDGRANGRMIDLTWRLHSDGELASVAVEVARMRLTAIDPFSAAETSETSQSPEGPTKARLEVPDYGRYAFRLKMVDVGGLITYSPVIELDATLENAYAIDPVYPNPTSGRATMAVAVREAQDVAIQLFDILGRRIATVYEGHLGASSTERVLIESEGLAEGVYLIVSRGPLFVDVQKVVVRR